MLPSVLARQFEQGLKDYIETTFPITNPVFKDSLKNMLKQRDAVFHEPYVAVRLPFRVYEGDREFFESITMKYPPYVHQARAFERLTGEDGRSTLVATGTGSGKTECFLYPILEYCYRHCQMGEKGIKAIIIYPMNALASDQAKRIAEVINENPKLKNAGVRVGMYVGGKEAASTKVMGADTVITDHDTLLTAPPDILMTNYKMLDYLLVRPKDATLWNNNAPDTLKYIAVDELHTFDGAQGTDLACLIRRLKARLNVMQGQLCCVGTSATMGSGSSAAGIRNYAEEIFGEMFEEDSVVTEDRLSVNEFFDGYDISDFQFPAPGIDAALKELEYDENEVEYLKQAVKAWCSDDFSVADIMSDDARVELGKHLMHHNFLRDLLTISRGDYAQNSYLIDEMSARFPGIKDLAEKDVVIDALYALISHARIYDANHKLRPFLNVQVQIWMRELRRLVAKVSDNDIQFALANDLNDNQAKHYLPVVNCRDCGETGWASLIDEEGCLKMTDLTTFYNLFFQGSSNVRLIFPHKKGDKAPNADTLEMQICPECLDISFTEGREPVCSNGHRTIPVWMPELDTTKSGESRKQFTCPFCGSRGGLSIMGLRSATAISAGVSQIYASKFNDDKKLLAFSDNVQDAAHRAGFFNSRTWKFGVRSAAQRFALQERDELTLNDFTKKCSEYWKQTLSEEQFVSDYIAPNMMWMQAYDDMKKTGKLVGDQASKDLVNNIQRRLEYEIFLEYGLGSRIGRTLEKSGSTVMSFHYDEAIANIMNHVQNDIGSLRGADEEIFRKMIFGFVYQMKINGAINHLIYGPFIEQGGNQYMVAVGSLKRYWLPGVRAGRNVPKFITINNSGKKKHGFVEINDKSWYVKWINKYLPVEERKYANEAEDIVRVIIDELTKQEILLKLVGPKDMEVWGLNPDKLTISKSVKQMVCDKCGSTISVSEENEVACENICCMRMNCNGHYHVKADETLDYYGKLYASGDMDRVIAQEHTGLLERDSREALERAFKSKKGDRRPWDPNLLSCTPTLEMGIDIGDLSTVVLCSIPPAQAQFAQRAGRGGRKDGNSLTVAVANARPHDLYFYADPKEMISGDIEPPKIFLKAISVLQRQFVAYCMDCWVKSGIPVTAIPPNVGACLTKLSSKDKNFFPFNFLNYVQNNLTKLTRMFIQTFSVSGTGETLDAEARKELEKFAKGDGLNESPMHMQILKAFDSLYNQREALRKDIKELVALIKELEAKPKDSSYEQRINDLKSERNALVRVAQDIKKKEVFNFLSDEGLLPNYAFPEAGIILKAVLYRNKNDDADLPEGEKGKRKFDKIVYEYNRSASSAISEFAPLNDFYVDGRKITIDQVDLGTSKIEPWRLCPNCSHAEPEVSTKVITVCPKCQCTGWADAGQVRQMLKVQMVYSKIDDKKSRISDDSDDRSSTFYCKEMLVDVDEQKDILKAYDMRNDEFPFGYEFVGKAVMREINFGQKDIVGENLSVAGRADIRNGFKVCKHCGKIQVGNKPVHTMFCKANKDTSSTQEPYEECLFLYREFQTEALRILIPATTMDSSKVRLESFVAAFMLGMKSKFGNVDHLRACVSEVPVPDADYRKQYLVIYDSVPGGTGYLRQLMNEIDGLIDVMQRAVDKMEHCSCKEYDDNASANEEKKDGCYKCLYAYRQSQHIGEISRTVATRLFKQILSGKDNREEIKQGGISGINTNDLFDSELERRFIEAFRRLGNENRLVDIHSQLVHEKPGYSLRIGECLWDIELQVPMGSEQGVSVNTLPDFVFWPKRTNGNQKPVVVYTDGYIYHKDKVGDDTLKRMAIMHTGKYRVWSLSYKDVQDIFQLQGDYYTHTLSPELMPQGPKMYYPTVQNQHAESIKPNKMKAFELLVEYLSNADAEKIFTAHAIAYSYSLLNMAEMNDIGKYQMWSGKQKDINTALDITEPIDAAGDAIFGRWEPRVNQGNIQILAEVSKKAMQLMKMAAPIRVAAIINDGVTKTDKFDLDWNGFWHFANILQFNSNAVFVTEKGVNSAIYTIIGFGDSVDVSDAVASQTAATSEQNEWLDMVEEYELDDEAKAAAVSLQKEGISLPDVIGYELENSSGAGIAEATMAWTNLKVVWLASYEEDYADTFVEHGWRAIKWNDEIKKEDFGGVTNE